MRSTDATRLVSLMAVTPEALHTLWSTTNSHTNSTKHIEETLDPTAQYTITLHRNVLPSVEFRINMGGFWFWSSGPAWRAL